MPYSCVSVLAGSETDVVTDIGAERTGLLDVACRDIAVQVQMVGGDSGMYVVACVEAFGLEAWS